MKITPDSSLFTALSNLPRADQGKRGAFAQTAIQEQQTPIRNRAGQGSGGASSTKDELIRRALADGNLRQQAVKRAQASAALETPAAQRGSVTREVPFASAAQQSENPPQFRRLGQIIDIRI